MPGKISVDFEQLETAMQRVRDAAGKIHIIDFQFVQKGKCDIPSYTRLREQLDTLNVLSQRTKNIMELAAGNVTAVYTELCNTDKTIQETLENG